MKRKHCASDTSDENPNKKLKVDFDALFKGKHFQDLTPQNQEIYCERKKQIMEDVWNQYEQAKEKHEYLVAAKAFAKAHKMGYFKATLPLSFQALPAIPMEGEPYVASSPKDYYYIGLCHYLGLGFSPNHETAVYYFKLAAEQGNAGAQCVMGLIHAEKLQVDHELEQALSWLAKSALQNYAPALDKLGLMYESGKGVNKNRNSAHMYWTSASNQGHAPSLVNLGLYFSSESNVIRNLKGKFQCFNKAAKQGFPEAQMLLGQAYYFGQEVIKDFQHAVFWYKKAAENGHAKGQFCLANAYNNGHGVDKDPKKAVFWHRKAAEQGFSGAQCNLGFSYFYGFGILQDVKEGLRWLKKAAEQNNVQAQLNLGFIYLNGDILTRNQAADWFKKAADQGNATAQYNLGLIYHRGNTVDQDLKEAFVWFKKAAEQGHASAQNELGTLYFNGNGVDKDLNESFVWFKKSAEQGHATGQYNIGLSYFLGRGVEKNEQESIVWYKKSAEQGTANALNALKQIATPLACYAVAWIEKNLDDMVKLLITDEKVQQEFLDKDLLKIATFCPDENALSAFIASLQKQAKSLTRDVDSFLVEWLLKLDLQTRSKGLERNEFQAMLISLLANAIELAEVKLHHIDPLMDLFCFLYYEESVGEENACFINPLIKLWHKSQSYCMSHDLGINRLFASVLIHHFFKDQYKLQNSLEISQTELAALVFTCENRTTSSSEMAKSLFQKMKLVETKSILQSLLPQLKTCLTQFDQKKSVSFFSVVRQPLSVIQYLLPELKTYVDQFEARGKHFPFISFIQKLLSVLHVQGYGNEECDAIFKEMRLAATNALEASEHNVPGFFSVVLKPQEKELAQLIQQEDTVKLSEWVKKVTCGELQLNSEPAYSNSAPVA